MADEERLDKLADGLECGNGCSAGVVVREEDGDGRMAAVTGFLARGVLGMPAEALSGV